MNTKSELAFTLAETLITIVIIGVVAAIILPLFIQNYQKKVTVEKLKKAYTVIINTQKMSETENGEIAYWKDVPDMDINDYFETYWKPYINIAQICNSSSYSACQYDSYPYRYIDNITYGAAFVQNNVINVLLKDGTLVRFESGSWSGNRILIDINASTGPNKMGQDVFFLQRTKKGIVPYSIDYNEQQMNYFCNKTIYGSGMSCLKKIITDGWKIKYDW